jgi:hypothetical protein
MFNIQLSNRLQTDAEEQKKLVSMNYRYFKVIVSPASGPRWSVTAGFDNLFKHLLASDVLDQEMWLVGGSTGALRSIGIISSIITGSDKAHELHQHYCDMYYKPGDQPSTLWPMMEELYSKMAPEDILKDIINHKTLKLGIFVAKFKSPYDKWPEFSRKLMMILILACNPLFDNAVSLMFDRYFFFTGETPPDCFASQYICHQLTVDNIKQVMHATTAVPFVHQDCKFIHGVGPGLFVDSALTDYVLNFTLDAAFPGLVLADYPEPRVKRTIFDLFLPSKISSNLTENCTIIYPRKSFENYLPERRMPSVSDWFDKKYVENPHLRKDNWSATYALSVKNFPANVGSELGLVNISNSDIGIKKSALIGD